MARRGIRRGARKRGWIGRIANWAVRAAVLFVVISLLWVALYIFVPPPITFTQIGDLLGGRGVDKNWTPLSRIDDDMERAAIAAEDSKFCSHDGFDQDAIAAAMLSNAEGRRKIRGGSTISQQTAKNAFLWQGGGYVRKGLEAWFTFLIETMWSKQRIMEVYLNVAETGIGTYGVEAGAQRYFGKGASNLTRQEAARIAAILPLPKKRAAIAPTGFTRRYGNSIAARIRVVQRDGLDSCLRVDGAKDSGSAEPAQRAKPKAKSVTPAPRPETAEDYINPNDVAPVVSEPREEEATPAPVEGPAPESNGL